MRLRTKIQYSFNKLSLDIKFSDLHYFQIYFELGRRFECRLFWFYYAVWFNYDEFCCMYIIRL